MLYLDDAKPVRLALIVLAGDPKSLRLTPSGVSYRDSAVAAALGTTAVPIDWVVVVVHDDPIHFDRQGSPRVLPVAGGNSAGQSLRKGMDAAGTAEQYMIVAGDLPHLTSAALDHYLEQVLRNPADVYMGFTPLAECERQYGQSSKHALEVDGRPVKAASIYTFNQKVWHNPKLNIERLLQNRKRLLLIGLAVLGFWNAVRLIRKKNQTVAFLERAIGQRFGFTVKGLLVSAEIAVDDDA